MDDAAFPDVVATVFANLAGVIKYLADLCGTKFSEARVGVEELAEATVVARVNPVVGLCGFEEDTLGIEREAASAGIICPEIVSTRILDRPSNKAIAPRHIP